jgi:adenine-specific DNA-methyltransferase
MEKITASHPLSHSADIIKQNLETLKELFPTIVKEGKIDVEELKALLGEELETGEEYYRFTWAGKSQARQEANKPSTGTLRPVKEESKDWDTTQNIFIEGDNLEVLKLLQKSYAGKIKMIYIDPPYNTGNDFVYKDNYADNLGNYLAITGQTDAEGRKLSTNTESDGRYHSNWLDMMYPRLKLARNLLGEDGLIFISIGQAEFANLTNVCNEIYGEENKIGAFVRLMKTGGNKGTFYSPNTEFVLIYTRNIIKVKPFRDEISKDLIEKVYTQIQVDGDRKGEKYRIMGLYQSYLDERPNQRYFIECPDGSYVIPPGVTMPSSVKDGAKVKPKKGDGVWRWTYERYAEEKIGGNVIFKKSGKADLIDNHGKQAVWNIYTKIWLKDREEEGRIPVDLLDKYENRQSSKELKQLGIPFDYAKPSGLISHLIKIAQIERDSLIMDFFAGSGTTAHSVMQLNSEDGGNRKYLCVQLPELTESESEAFKEGYKTIAEITKERIRRAGEMIKSEIKEDLFTKKERHLDIGFRVFKLDSSNINAWDGSVQKFEQNLLSVSENIKSDRSEEDVLYEILLKSGLGLAQPIEEKSISGKKVFSIGIGALFICLADKLTTAVAEGIGKWKKELEPATCRVIFKDTGFNDVGKTNSIQILKHYGITEVNSI